MAQSRRGAKMGLNLTVSMWDHTRCSAMAYKVEDLRGVWRLELKPG